MSHNQNDPIVSKKLLRVGFKVPKWLTTTLKIIFSIALLYLVLTKIDLVEIWSLVRSADYQWLLVAVFLFFVSKVFNSYRLNLFFKAISVQLSERTNFKLYLLGMFYNLFLPGGIGGDAYKAYLIQKKFSVSTKKVIGVLFIDRLSGLFIILVFTLVLMYWVNIPIFIDYQWVILPLILFGTFIFWLLVKKIFSYAQGVFWSTTGYSVLVQTTQLLAVVALLFALQIEASFFGYLLVFLFSSIISVIPLTIGGVGSRELTFMYGAAWLGLLETKAVAISFLFFAITALVSLFGVFFVFNKIELNRSIKL